MKLIRLIYILLGFINLCSGQSYYQIIPFAEKGNFIYPPHSKLKHSCNETTVKKSCRYQYVYFKSIETDNYYNALSSLKNVKYLRSKKAINELNKKKYKIDTIIQLNAFVKVAYSKERKTSLLQIDYSNTIDGKTESEVRKIFFEVAKDLLIEFYKREGREDDRFGWPTSISQDMVEKVFELIPIPSQSSLLRYVAQIDNDKSFVLLNPKIKLKVETVEKIEKGANWYFNLSGTSIITINRDNNGNIVQNPFHKFQVKGMPDNTAVDNSDSQPDIIHQASTEDIQLSETLRDNPFIFLYQNSFKANTIQLPSSNNVCNGTLNDRFDCNSMLVHYRDLSQFFNSRKNDLSLPNAKYISSFGFRNLITPLIDITVNGNFTQCPLGLSFNQLKSQMAIPQSFEIYRFWNGKYVKMRSDNLDNLILLADDKIIF